MMASGTVQAVAAEGESESMYFVTERDLRKLERNKRKDERQRMVGGHGVSRCDPLE